MKIAIEAFHLLLGKGGIYNTILNFVDYLKNKKDLQVVLFYNYKSKKNLIFPQIKQENVKEKHFIFPKRILHWLWNNINYPKIESIIGDIDIFHGTHFVLPPVKKAKNILTVHDLTYLKYPQYYDDVFVNEYGYKKLLPESVKRAQGIICISQSTFNDFKQLFPYYKNKIKIIFDPINREFFKLNINKQFKNLFKIDRPYIYYPAGIIDLRKNFQNLIKAYNLIKSEHPDFPVLLISGYGDYRKYVDMTKNLDLKNVIFYKYKNIDEYIYLIDNAEFIIYPSLYEGFGLPVAESLARGKLVITSNISSLKEFETFDKFDPENIESIKAALEKAYLLDNKTKDLFYVKAKKFSEKFKPDNIGQQIIDFYKEIL